MLFFKLLRGTGGKYGTNCDTKKYGVGKGVQILEENVTNISLGSLPILIFCSIKTRDKSILNADAGITNTLIKVSV